MSTPEYCVLYGETHGELEHEVQRYLEAGWLPQGGIAVHQSPATYYQAMFRIKGAVRTQVVSVVDEASGDE